jgi:hypothetical protein
MATDPSHAGLAVSRVPLHPSYHAIAMSARRFHRMQARSQCSPAGPILLAAPDKLLIYPSFRPNSTGVSAASVEAQRRFVTSLPSGSVSTPTRTNACPRPMRDEWNAAQETHVRQDLRGDSSDHLSAACPQKISGKLTIIDWN